MGKECPYCRGTLVEGGRCDTSNCRAENMYPLESYEYLNQMTVFRLSYAHEGGMYSVTQPGTRAWGEYMKNLVGKHIDGYGILTYIGPPV